MNNLYFFDSYAIIEMLLGSENYTKYKGSVAFTTKLNLFEVFSSLLKNLGEIKANEFLEKDYKLWIDYDNEIIKEAAKFRLANKEKNLSMTDCIGYTISKRLGIKFLTGDKEFENLSNVEFVK